MGISEFTSVPNLLFALLAIFFFQKAIRPGAKQNWSWGRGGGPVPLSRGSYACIAATFFSISLLITSGPEPPLAYVVGFLICFLGTLGAGFVDTHRYRKAQRLQGVPPDQRV